MQPIPGWNRLIHHKDRFEESGSDECFLFLIQTLHECSTKHKKCAQTVVQLPTRVIDTGDSSSKDGTAKVVRGEDLMATYATLSYCWGKWEGLKLTTLNVGDMERGLPWKHLPVLFRDAITVVRRLGIRYLWIDALCIMQDSLEDWRKEAVKMGRYFRHSSVSIASTAGTSPEQPILKRRSRAWRCGKFLFKPAQGHVSYPLSGRRVPWDFETGILKSRAWAYQEEELAPRIISFEEHTVSVHCNQVRRYETGEKDLEYKSWSHNVEQRSGNLNLWWQWRVNAYSKRDLTYESDRLPAIAGVAKLLHEQTSWEYFAGLWLSNPASLPRTKRCQPMRQLLWMRRDGSYHDGPSEPFHPRPEVYRAPSWSWASVNGSIAFGMDTIFGIQTGGDGRLGRPVASLVECSCTPAAEDAYIQLSAGYVKLEAYLCSAELTARPNALRFRYTVKIYSGAEGQNTELWPDCVLEATEVENAPPKSINSSITGDSDSGLSLRTRRHPTVKRSSRSKLQEFDSVPVVFAPLAMALDDLFFGILLGRTDNFGVYSRLGYVRCDLTPESVFTEAQRLVYTII